MNTVWCANYFYYTFYVYSYSHRAKIIINLRGTLPYYIPVTRYTVVGY